MVSNEGGIVMTRPWYKFYPEGVPYEIDIPEYSMFDILDQSAKRVPENVAIIDGEKILTYTELITSVERLASALSKRGFRKGDRLAIMLINSAEYIISFYAVQRLGGTVVQVNPMYQPQELEYILRDSEAAWFIGHHNQESKLEKIGFLDKLTTVYVGTEGGDSFDGLIQEKNNKLPKMDINLKEDVAVLQYTGGTTGFPKGVMMTHFTLFTNIYQTYVWGKEVYDEPNHKQLGISPLFHAMGMTIMNLGFFIGGMYVAAEKFQAKSSIELIKKHGITMFLGSPTMYSALLNCPDLQDGDLKSLKLCNSGAAPMPVEVMREFERVSGARIIESYGQSESNSAITRNPYKGLRKVGSIGIPTSSTDVKIVDIETGTKEMPVGEAGELIVKGPQVMIGYWKNPEETAKTIRNGWLYTGDLATRDEDGFFYIVGRKKDMIISGGFNIYPVEIDNVLYEHPAVKEACAFGIPDSYLGEKVKAVVAVEGDVTEEEIKEWCFERLAKYKVPRSIDFREELPKTSVGKILRRTLVEEELAKINL